MNILENYYKKVIKYDLINKFLYTHSDEIPQLKKIILNFGCKNFEIKSIASALLSLELITTKRGSLIKSKRSNILLKIRKGYPVGCIVVLKKNKMYMFFLKLLSEVFPNLKELEKQFYLFTNLPPLNITLITNAKTKKELLYLLNSFKLPII
jgi:large subunit ribosomal protein L5